MVRTLRRCLLYGQQLRLPGRRGQRGLPASSESRAQAGWTIPGGNADGDREPAPPSAGAPVVEGGRDLSPRGEPVRRGADATRHRVHVRDERERRRTPRVTSGVHLSRVDGTAERLRIRGGARRAVDARGALGVVHRDQEITNVGPLYRADPRPRGYIVPTT